MYCVARLWLGEKTRLACLETCAKLTSSFLVHTQERRAFILHFRPNQKAVRKRTGNHYLLRLHRPGQCLTKKEIWQICNKDFGHSAPEKKVRSIIRLFPLSAILSWQSRWKEAEADPCLGGQEPGGRTSSINSPLSLSAISLHAF